MAPLTHNFLGLFLKVFGWVKFSITVIETCPRDMLPERENWYLLTFKPLLNVLKKNYTDPRVPGTQSLLTRSKISATLKGRKDNDVTRAKKQEKSASRIGSLNPFFGKGPGKKSGGSCSRTVRYKSICLRCKQFYSGESQTFSKY